MTIGKQLRARRLEAQLTQRQLAEAVGTDAVYISRIERDMGTPSLDMVRRILRVTGGTVQVPPST